MIPTRKDKKGEMRVNYISPQGYIDRSGAWLVENGFHEKEIHRVTEKFGNMAHVFSSYEAFKSGEDKPFMRGINSIQLLYDNDRWYVVNIYWQQESEAHLLPAEYLPE